MKNYNRMPENFLWGGATAATSMKAVGMRMAEARPLQMS